MAAEDSKIGVQLDALARHFITKRAAIMRAWRQSVRTDPDLKTALSLPRSRFDDHIPAAVDAFCQQLKSWPGQGMMVAEEQQEQSGADHGAQRWQQGYAVTEVGREWSHLHLCMLDELETYAEIQKDIDPTAWAICRRLLVIFCGQGVSRSIEEFARLQQAEAAVRVRDLEAALDELNELHRQRAETWREAAHDLRNTVGLVTNATGILRRADAPDTLRAKSLSTLQNGVTSLRTMLNDLLSLARLEAGQEQLLTTPFNADRVLKEVCEQLQPEAASHAVFLRVQGRTEFSVEGDEEKVARIARNLVGRVVRTATEGGITVAWSDAEGDHHWVLSVEHTGASVQGGSDMPLAREIEQITAQASGEQSLMPPQANGASNGTLHAKRPHGEGIALSIVKHMCELLDATLEMENDGVPGSRARVIFPRSYSGK
jgi:signal transduction histidine kinase